MWHDIGLSSKCDIQTEEVFFLIPLSPFDKQPLFLSLIKDYVPEGPPDHPLFL